MCCGTNDIPTNLQIPSGTAIENPWSDSRAYVMVAGIKITLWNLVTVQSSWAPLADNNKRIKDLAEAKLKVLSLLPLTTVCKICELSL